jgi:hypothetical protein
MIDEKLPRQIPELLSSELGSSQSRLAVSLQFMADTGEIVYAYDQRTEHKQCQSNEDLEGQTGFHIGLIQPAVLLKRSWVSLLK